MRVTKLICSCFVSLSLLCVASKLPFDHVLNGDDRVTVASVAEKEVSRVKASDPSCTNGPLTRHCWTGDYSINTDFDERWPTTGKTVSYDLEITNTTCNPDGSAERVCLLLNNQLPGPTIRAKWGDYLKITVTNKMQHNGTSIHWHGIRQLYTNGMDGVNGITQCPIAPGGSFTYHFQATQYGTSWYHSHFSVQYGDGVAGPIVIEGPSSANYDIDLGPVAVTDWFYQTAWQISSITNAAVQQNLPGPASNTVLINGMNKSPTGNGTYSQFIMSPGKTHKFRIVNTSIDNFIRISIDNHTMQVITSDFTPIRPYYANSVLLGAGQRSEVIVAADQPVGNYWMRAISETACASSSDSNALAIVRYDSLSTDDPTTTDTAMNNECKPSGALVPWVYNLAGSEQQFKDQVKTLPVGIYAPGASTNKENLVMWGINMTGINIRWHTPTLSYVTSKDNGYPTDINLIEVPRHGVWTYWIVQEIPGTSVTTVPHPLHLHGHDFYILASGNGTFDTTTDLELLNFSNPPRRDTAILPAGGWLILAFPSDNPGAWLFHCHIGWHIAEGLGVQFLENKDNITVPTQRYNDICYKWDEYLRTALYKKLDSGLKRRSRQTQF